MEVAYKLLRQRDYFMGSSKLQLCTASQMPFQLQECQLFQLMRNKFASESTSYTKQNSRHLEKGYQIQTSKIWTTTRQQADVKMFCTSLPLSSDLGFCTINLNFLIYSALFLVPDQQDLLFFCRDSYGQEWTICMEKQSIQLSLIQKVQVIIFHSWRLPIIPYQFRNILSVFVFRMRLNIEY